jgi:hypothetical protein
MTLNDLIELTDKIVSTIRPIAICMENDPAIIAEIKNPEILRISGENIIKGIFMSYPEAKNFPRDYLEKFFDSIITKLDNYPIMRSMFVSAKEANNLRSA